MECANCGHTFEGNFCPNCGTPAPQKEFCPQCGKERTAGALFCGQCGYRFAAQGSTAQGQKYAPPVQTAWQPAVQPPAAEVQQPPAGGKPAEGKPCRALAFLDKPADKLYKVLYFFPACAFALVTLLLFAFLVSKTSTRLALTGVTKVTFRGKKVTGFLRPLWNKNRVMNRLGKLLQ